MKAISLWQPWASLWACKRKRFETRHWATAYRGPLAIHAAQKMVAAPGEDLDEILIDEFGVYWRATLPRGAILATARLVACRPTETMVWQCKAASLEEMIQGDFSDGRFAWEIADLSPLARPVVWGGRQGLFNVPDRDELEARP
jgi:hypothetical protein